jgi:hypothetical protein
MGKLRPFRAPLLLAFCALLFPLISFAAEGSSYPFVGDIGLIAFGLFYFNSFPMLVVSCLWLVVLSILRWRGHHG